VGRIVVGVDSSEGSRVALRWALDEARIRHDTLEAVHVWHPPYAGAEAYVPSVIDTETLEGAATELLAEVLAAEDSEGVTVVPRVLCGAPAATLLEAADGASLLVVGSRGLGGFSRLLLGSVSEQVVHHAGCPVAVVPIDR
jgi:nucleotide-binding universal stress UspA family protein